MRIALCELESMSPYSQSRPLQTPKDRDENHQDYEKRVWRERCHTDKDGQLFIPPMAFKNCIAEAAKYKSIQIPGKGKSTYTKHFEAGIMVLDPAPIGISLDDVDGEWLFVPSDGRRGSGSRVWKCFPKIEEWSVIIKIYVLDEIITAEVFEQHLIDAGQFIGIGRFRPRNNGFYGRFSVKGIKWETQK